ncbi:MAG: hypothetical protein WED10_03720 [Brumimicrobium sp.]
MIILNLLNRIFGLRGSLTRDDIESYQKGTGNAHDIEEKSLSSDFDADALDGWSEEGTPISEMESLDKKFRSKYTSKTFSIRTTIFFTLFFVASGMILIFTYSANKNITTDKIASSLSENNREIPFSNKETQEKDQIQNNIENLKVVNEEKEVQPKSLQHDKKSQDKNLEKVNLSTIENHEEKENNIDNTLSPDVSKNIPVEERNNTLHFNYANEVYLNDFKLVDYRVYRDAPIKTGLHIPAGTPANQESKTDISEANEEKEVEIPYIEYIEKTMGYFESSSYKKALKRYNIILSTYPDDVNANFYGGLCYYNLGEFDKAINYLNKSYTIEFGNFREEAMWFKSKALIENGQLKASKILLEQIIKEDGFYSREAESLLKEIINK